VKSISKTAWLGELALGDQPLKTATILAFWAPTGELVAEPGYLEDRPVLQIVRPLLSVTEEVVLSAIKETRAARLRMHKQFK
jgi:hypothetical protein